MRVFKRRLAARAAGARDSLKQIAADFGVARSTIKDIAMEYSWRHIE